GRGDRRAVCAVPRPCPWGRGRSRQSHSLRRRFFSLHCGTPYGRRRAWGFRENRGWKDCMGRRARNGEPAMFAVIFELQPKPEKFDEYLALAKYLKPKLEAIDGFIDIDRFSRRHTKRRLLSLSSWRDEKAIVRWRTQAEHHAVQEKGRFEVFEDYHLRVGEITVDTAVGEGLEEQRFDATEAGQAKVVTITEVVLRADHALGAEVDRLSAYLGLRARSDGVIDQQAFESIYHSGQVLL